MTSPRRDLEFLHWEYEVLLIVSSSFKTASHALAQENKIKFVTLNNYLVMASLRALAVTSLCRFDTQVNVKNDLYSCS